MGFFMSKSMDESLKKQQEFMAANSALQLQRQILMQDEMRQRQVAMQIAWSREFIKYFGSFFGLTTIGLTLGAMKRKTPVFLFPIVPLSFILAYQYDLAYGTLMIRMKDEAENIIDTERTLLDMPKGVPTFESIEKARRARSIYFSQK
ncbi:plasminogen receptor (KT) [Carcharodon carcharias]|uniref:plasminogen receptor (KT) n=1 Tax=Carcharodon carcharias TaxID=13397 RepID=UPI001B7F2F0D|nr:plasminogen receptor (KT) [Carcharodon carcharias]